MSPENIGDFSSVYSAWFGRPILLFIVRRCQVPIPCNIIAESAAAVRVQLEPGWEIDVRKELILAVEEATASWEDFMN